MESGLQPNPPGEAHSSDDNKQTADAPWRKTVISPGDGVTHPQPKDRATVWYTGKLSESGKVFDSNIGKSPMVYEVGITPLIRGWEEAVPQMTLGEKCVLEISSEYAYGERGYDDAIPPHSSLTFEIELVDLHPYPYIPRPLTEEQEQERLNSFLPADISAKPQVQKVVKKVKGSKGKKGKKKKTRK